MYDHPMASPPPVTWISKDYHVHESHSSDAPGATVEKYCRVAERRGIDELAFTSHFIISGPDWEFGLRPHQIQGYLEEIEAVQETTEVALSRGIEVDYFPKEERVLERILDDHEFDFILGSLHYINGIDIGSRRGFPRFFGGRPFEESLNIYFDGWRDAVESGLFDAMAHPDYFRKYLHLTRPEPATWEEYGTTVYEALDSLRSHGVGIEVNSSGIRHGIGDVYPVQGFLEAALEAGVDRVTVGSDCHTVDDLGLNTQKALSRLEDAGYGHLCVYEMRRNRKVSLSDVRMKVPKEL